MSFLYYVRFFALQYKIKLLRALEYRFDFVTGIIVSFIFSCAGPVFQFFIYFRTNGYPNWDFNQMILFQAVLLLWLGIMGTFLGNIRSLITIIAQSSLLDRFLLFPHPPISMIVASGFNHNSFGTLLAGMIALIYSIIKLQIVLHWYQVLLFLICFLLGALFYITIMILYSAITIRLVFVERLNQMIDNLINFSNFPAEVFPSVARLVYLVFFPLAVWAYYPSLILLGRIDNIILYAALAVILLFIASLFIWNSQLKRYSSSGG